jgi:hypothetical protein
MLHVFHKPLKHIVMIARTNRVSKIRHGLRGPYAIGKKNAEEPYGMRQLSVDIDIEDLGNSRIWFFPLGP